MLPAFFLGLRPTLHISHRGGALLAPENTRAAFDLAIERWRTDMLELDLHLTRDGQLVVSHDPTVQRCTNGEGPIREQTLAELQRLDAGYHFTPDSGLTYPFRGRGVRMPSFQEVLVAYPGLPLNVELKQDAPGAAEAFAAEVRALGAGPRVCVGSELDWLAERLVNFCRKSPTSTRAMPWCRRWWPSSPPAPSGGPLQPCWTCPTAMPG